MISVIIYSAIGSYSLKAIVLFYIPVIISIFIFILCGKCMISVLLFTVVIIDYL